MVQMGRILKSIAATLALACLASEAHSSEIGQSGQPCRFVNNVEIKLKPFRCEPLYPTRARQREIEGWVEVSFTINPDGLVSDVSLFDEQPSFIFEQSAISMAERFRFDPALLNGRTLRDARYLFIYLID